MREHFIHICLDLSPARTSGEDPYVRDPGAIATGTRLE